MRTPNAWARRAICSPLPPRPSSSIVLPRSSVRGLFALPDRFRVTRQQQGERLLGDLRPIEPPRVSQRDLPAVQRFEHLGRRASRRRLQPAQLLTRLDDLRRCEA